MNLGLLRIMLCATAFASVSPAVAFSPANAMGAATIELPARAVAPGTKNVALLSFDLEVSCDGNRTVRQITFVYDGPGKLAELPHLSVSIDGGKAETLPPIDPRSLTVSLTFQKKLEINACKTARFDILADVPATATEGSAFSLMVELESDILTDASKIYSVFPLQGPTITVNHAANDRKSCLRDAARQETSQQKRAARAACRQVAR
jgi:hypothetical protein